MRKIIILTSLLFHVILVSAQKYERDTICTDETIIKEETVSKKVGGRLVDSTYTYKAVLCNTRSLVGIGFGTGISVYNYNEKTDEWLGQHITANFFASIVYGKASFGFRYKTGLVSNKKEMVFDGKILTKQADLQPRRFDYTLAYSLDFNEIISFEPFVGYTRSSFSVYNEAWVEETYSFSKTGGLLTGLNLHAYVYRNVNRYMVLSAKFGYGFVDFSKVHPDLDKGYFEWSIDFALKAYFPKSVYRKVE
jgi:hypothetical protein